MDEKIMVVDDDEEFLEELRETLNLSGYRVIIVNDSTTALDTACTMKPDVILLDLKMDKKSGFKIADELKRVPETAHIPTIAMSGFYVQKYHNLLLKICGIKRFLKKPFNPLDVIAKIEAAL